ncbi:MAG: glycosyltransferase family 39 protein [Alphaproteobacteria bacterium]|nr:glycosyltransferase family 39 protein [Alphaproteobacteria bacterium]
MTWLSDGFRPYVALVLFCLALYLPGLAAVPPLDRDEARFAQATRQMVETGDYVHIFFQDEARTKKPVGIHWMQAASVRMLDAEQAIWAYRLPSVLGVLAAALLTFAYGTTLVGRQGALLGAAFLAAALVAVLEAHQAKTDAMLLACVVAAQGTLARFYLRGKAGAVDTLLFWLAQGVGILIKGPIVPLVTVLTMAALGVADRRIGWARSMRVLSGLVIVAAIVGPWAAAVSAGGNGFIGKAIETDLLPKLIGGHESHGAWPGYYLLLATLTLWPASLFVPAAFVRAWRGRATPALRFLLAWVIPAWVVFELVPTKLPHYTLPLYPALALLAGWAVVNGDVLLKGRGTRYWGWAWGLVGAGLAGAAIAAPILMGDGLSLWSAPAALAALAAAVAPPFLLRRGRATDAALAALGLALVTYGAIFAGVLPGLERMWISQGVAQAVERAGTRWPVATAGYREPSLVFLLGTETLLTDGPGAAHHLLASPDALAVVESREDEAFLATLAGRPAETLATIQGFNYSRGREQALHLYRLAAP